MSTLLEQGPFAVFLALAIAHALADFPLQTAYLAEQKNHQLAASRSEWIVALAATHNDRGRSGVLLRGEFGVDRCVPYSRCGDKDAPAIRGDGSVMWLNRMITGSRRPADRVASHGRARCRALVRVHPSRLSVWGELEHGVLLV